MSKNIFEGDAGGKERCWRKRLTVPRFCVFFENRNERRIKGLWKVIKRQHAGTHFGNRIEYLQDAVEIASVAEPCYAGRDWKWFVRELGDLMI